MAGFLATWELGQRYGHVATLAPVAAALARQGHRTIFAARDPETARLRAPGTFERILQAPIYTRRVDVGETLVYGQVIAEAGYVDVETVCALVRGWLALFEMTAPDAILVEHAPVSLLAAHVAGIPAMRLGPTFTSPHARDPLPTLQPWIAHPQEEIAEAGKRADLIVRGTCRSFGAPALAGLAELLERSPNHALTWPELDHYGPQAGLVYHGPLAGIDASAKPAWPDAPGPRTLVYHGLDTRAGNAAAKALGRLGWPVIWHAQSAPSDPLPVNILFSSEPVDITALAREADLYVSRGGHGASAAMLRAGIPQLLLPDSLESLLVAWRLQKAGIALAQSGTAGAEAVADALQRIAGDGAMRSTARALGGHYADYDAQAAADGVAASLCEAPRA